MNMESQQFQSGQKVRNQFGDVLTVLQQDGCQVFVEEEFNCHYHPSKLFPVVESTAVQSR